MEDSFVRGVVWTAVAAVGLCVLVCVCNCCDNIARNVNEYREQQRQDELRRAGKTGSTLPYEIISPAAGLGRF